MNKYGAKRTKVDNGALNLVLPVPPSTNNAYATSFMTGRRTLTQEGKRYKTIVYNHAFAESLKQRWYLRPHGSRLSLSLLFYFPNKRRRDISNCVKLIEDAMSEALGFDDQFVDILHVERKGVDKENPRCEASISVINE